MLLVAITAAGLAADDSLYRSLTLPPRKRITIDLERGAFKALFIWESEGDDDPSVEVIYESVSGVEYQREPFLTNSVFVHANSVHFQARSQLKLQIWKFQADLCSSATFIYSTSIALVEELTLTEEISKLCFFFDNPSKNAILIAGITGTEKRAPKGSVDIYDTNLQPSGNCTKRQCNARLNHQFFLRFADLKEQTRIRIEAHFDGHDTQDICGREGVTFYRENETIQPKLASKNEEFVCDDTFKIVIKKNSAAFKVVVLLVVLGTIVSIACYKKRPREPLPQKVPRPKDFDAPQSFRGGERFEQAPE
jgi:hypothetical protein